MAKQQIISAGDGQNYEWSSDHIYIKTHRNLTDGRVIVVEDTLKPGFHLPRHHHRVMTEIFYILDGEIDFKFDDETIRAVPGMTLNIPPFVWHDVQSQNGAKMLTIFSPGGFDLYLAEMAALTSEQFADTAFMTHLAEQYDTWLR